MIIGLCGLIGSGKGTVADILVENYNFSKISFADKLKDTISVMFDYPRDLLEGITPESREWREQPDPFWTNELGKEISPRSLLQTVGTECMRKGFFDEIWVSFVKKKILENPKTNWVIPDVRFKNEAFMVKSLKGYLWQVRKGPDPLWFRMYKDLDIEPVDVHSSEWEWAHLQMDCVLANDQTIDDLKNLVASLLVSK